MKVGARVSTAAPLTRVPGTALGACFAGPHSPWPAPLLHRLRSGSLRFVRRLPSYYGGGSLGSMPPIIMSRGFIARWTRMPPFHQAIEHLSAITHELSLAAL